VVVRHAPVVDESGGDGEPVSGGGVAELADPADEVVGDDGAGKPGSDDSEVPGRDVGEAGSFFS
jgi:hypothetical protein